MIKTCKCFWHHVLRMLFMAWMICFWPGIPGPVNAQTSPPSNLKILTAPPIILDAASDSGSMLLYLQNSGKKPLALALSAKGFINQTTQQDLGAKTYFSHPNSTLRKVVYEKFLAPGATEIIEVFVSKIWEAGESVAELLNHGEVIGHLKVLRNNLPFNVTLLNQGPDKTLLFFEHAKPARLILKNDDPMTYPIHWELHLDGNAPLASDLVLPPRSSSALEFDPPAEWFRAGFTELYNKKPARKGTLTIRLIPPSSISAAPWSVRTIPIEAQLSGWSPLWRQIWSNLIIFIVLALGGICSLVLSAWIPNQRRRLDLKERLSLLAGQISEISPRIDSYLRVALRVERHRLSKILYSRLILTSDIATLFNKYSQSIGTLAGRVEILVQLDRSYERLQALCTPTTPLSLIDHIEENLADASQILKKSEPQEAELQTAQTLVNTANLDMEKMNQPDAQFKQMLVDRLTQLQVRFQQDPDALIKKETSRRLEKQLPGPFGYLLVDPQKQTDLCKLDANIIRLELIKEYICLYENNPDPENRRWLNTHENDLVKMLRSQNRDNLLSARSLVRQLQEGIAEDEIRQEISRPQKISIQMDPEMMRANQPVKFKTQFLIPKFNQATARDLIVCEWNFGHDNLTEKGWSVNHYFPRSCPYTVSLTFRGADGQLLANPVNPSTGVSEGVLTLQKTFHVFPDETLKSRDRFKVELLYLCIVLGGTLLGLMAGAKDKLMQLDLAPGLIAVFLLGFGADTIKNLLTQRQSQ